MLRVCRITNDTELASHIIEGFASRTVPQRRERLFKFVRWQDRQATLFGDLLLDRLLRENTSYSLKDVVWNSYGKPELEGFHLSVSHSGSVVIALLSTIRSAVDVEEIKPIDFNDFHLFFTPEELVQMDQKLPRFYEFWTKKEAAIKADGRGMRLNPLLVKLQNNQAVTPDDVWHLTPLHFDANYACHFASVSALDFTSDQVECLELMDFV